MKLSSSPRWATLCTKGLFALLPGMTELVKFTAAEGANYHCQPLARLLTETDNPGGQQWLAGALGMPSLIQRVGEHLAALRQLAPTELQTVVQENFQRLAPEVSSRC